VAVQRFEDLIAWQKARLLAKSIYFLTGTGRLGGDLRLTGQMRSSAVSVMANIAEGFERQSIRDFHRVLGIAKASCAELRAELYVAADAGLVGTDEFTQALRQAEEVGRIIGGLRRSLASRIESRKP